jgi:hypothetical protein
MSNPAAIAKLARLAIGALDGSSGSAATQRLFFTSFKPNCKRERIDIGENVGGFGDLGHGIELTRQNITRVAPVLQTKPSTAEWKYFLDWLMNASPTGTGVGGDPYLWPTPGIPAKSRVIEFDDTQQFWHMTGNVVSRATISAEAGKEVQLSIELQGIDFTNTGTFPTLTYAASLGPRFLFGDQAITIAGITGAVRCRRMTLVIDHGIINDRFFYGFTSQGPVNTDRTYNLSLDIPYGLHPTLTGLCAVDGGVAGTITFGYGASAMVFTLPKLRTPVVSADADVARDEQFLPWEAQAFDNLTAPSSGFQVSLVL